MGLSLNFVPYMVKAAYHTPDFHISKHTELYLCFLTTTTTTKITVTRNADKPIAMRMVNIKAPRTFSMCVFQQVGCLACFLLSVCAMVGNHSKNFIPDGTILHFRELHYLLMGRNAFGD